MHGLRRNPWLFGLGVLLATAVMYSGVARADVTSDRPGAVVIFPKVIADDSGRDTLIQITNTGPMPVNAHCLYINTSATAVDGFCSPSFTQRCGVDSDCPLDVNGQHCVRCAANDFDIFLTAQQPTWWLVSRGRLDPSVAPGFFPGRIPPQRTTGIPGVPDTEFVGELKCVVTDGPVQVSPPQVPGLPLAQNFLKGEALITGPQGMVSEYNAITIQAKVNPGGDDLKLDDQVYNSCPADLVLDHRADGTIDSFTGLPVSTELTLTPCTEDFETQGSSFGALRTVVDMTIVDEFEGVKSVEGVNFYCRLSLPLSEINPVFTRDNIGSDFVKTRIRPSTGKICYSGTNRNLFCTTDDSNPTTGCPGAITTPPPGNIRLGCRPVGGVLGVAEEVETTQIVGGGAGSAAVDLHIEGNRPGDFIRLSPTN